MIKKKDKVLNIRLSADDYLLLMYSAKLTRITPSELLRRVIDSSVFHLKNKIDKGELTYEYIKEFCNHKL